MKPKFGMSILRSNRTIIVDCFSSKAFGKSAAPSDPDDNQIEEVHEEILPLSTSDVKPKVSPTVTFHLVHRIVVFLGTNFIWPVKQLKETTAEKFVSDDYQEETHN